MPKNKTKTKRIRKSFPILNRKTTKLNGAKPSIYDDIRFPQIAYSACLHTGCDNKILGAILGVGPNTIKTWCFNHERFRVAVKTGRDEYDGEKVESTLLAKALGYSYEEETWERKKTGYAVNPDTNMIDKDLPIYEMILTKVEKKQQAPDTTSIIFWLKNRDPERWRDVNRQRIELPDGPLQVTNTYNTQNNLQVLLQDSSPDQLALLEDLSNRQLLIEAEDASGSNTARH